MSEVPLCLTSMNASEVKHYPAREERDEHRRRLRSPSLGGLLRRGSLDLPTLVFLPHLCRQEYRRFALACEQGVRFTWSPCS